MSDFQTVCKVSDVKPGEGKTVAVGNRTIALFVEKGNHFALDDHCPHMGASLAGGYCEDGVVTCPWHAWRFRLCDGAWADNPRIKTRTYPVRIDGEHLQIQVPDTPSTGYSS